MVIGGVRKTKTMKRVKLILEYDMGEYPDDSIETEMKIWEDCLQQIDVLTCYLKIREVHFRDAELYNKWGDKAIITRQLTP